MAELDKQYLAYIKNTAAKLASGYSVPSTPRKWKALRETIRSRVIESIGVPQVDRCELLPRVFCTWQSKYRDCPPTPPEFLPQ